VQASDLGLGTPLRIALKAAIVGSAERNLEVTGTLGPVGNPPAPLTAPVDLTLAMPALDLDALHREVPALAASLPADVVVAGSLALQGHARGTAEKLVLDGTLDATAADLRQGTTFHKPAGVPLRVTAE